MIIDSSKNIRILYEINVLFNECNAGLNMTDAEFVIFYSERYIDMDAAEFILKHFDERLFALCNMVEDGEFWMQDWTYGNNSPNYL